MRGKGGLRALSDIIGFHGQRLDATPGRSSRPPLALNALDLVGIVPIPSKPEENREIAHPRPLHSFATDDSSPSTSLAGRCSMEANRINDEGQASAEGHTATGSVAQSRGNAAIDG